MFRVIFILFSLNFCNPCPAGCSCEEKNVLCVNISREDSDHLVKLLDESPLNETVQLRLTGLTNFSINSLPRMLKLRHLEMKLCYNDSEWNLQRDHFPELKHLRYTSSGLKSFSRALMSSFPTLQHLDLSDNLLENIGLDSFHLRMIETISIRNNNIRSIGVHVFRYMPTLHALDLSGNNMTRLVTSDFTSAISLRQLNLSHNRIQLIESDTTNSLQQLESLDLSSNYLREIPFEAHRNFVNLITLNLSNNFFEIIHEGFLQLPELQVLNLINCSTFIVEAGAFIHLPRLHSLDIQNNPNLVFFSPYALSNNTGFYRLNIQNTGFKRIPLIVLDRVSQLYIQGINLDCTCAAIDMHDFGAVTIVDWNNATCRTKNSSIQKLSHLSQTDGSCRNNLLTPLGVQQTAIVGHSYRIHCADDGGQSKMYWKAPNTSSVEANKPKLNTLAERKVDYFTTTLLEPSHIKTHEERVHFSTEYIGFDVVLESDSGNYECVSKNKLNTVTRKIELNVVKPDINLNVSHVSSTSVHLSWNKNLQVAAVDRVALQIVAVSAKTFKRQVQLSLYNIFRSYNLVNLSAKETYEICLEWYLTDDGVVIYKSCITVTTKPFKTVIQSFTPKLVIVLIVIALAAILLCCGSCIHQKIAYFSHIKKQAKMQQSVSGQSMLSQSSNDATTYENFQLSISSSSDRPLI